MKLKTIMSTTAHLPDGLYLTLLAADRKVPSEVSCLPIEKCLLPLAQPTGNNIAHTERSWCQGQLSCKDGEDGRHVLIFHFVGVSKHVAAGCEGNEAHKMC